MSKKRKQTPGNIYLNILRRLPRYLQVALWIVVIGALIWMLYGEKSEPVTVEADNKIDITPEQIESIKEIGEWEFLSVSDEQLIDTIRKGIFSDDQLVRIYYGTLRLGVNMHKVRPGWIKVKGDTVVATLPKVGLLDKDFIDEARTKSFFETGTWKPKDREAMYKRAYRKMKQQCLTPVNIKSAENNADIQFRNLMRSMGYDNVIIRFEK